MTGAWDAVAHGAQFGVGVALGAAGVAAVAYMGAMAAYGVFVALAAIWRVLVRGCVAFVAVVVFGMKHYADGWHRPGDIDTSARCAMHGFQRCPICAPKVYR